MSDIFVSYAREDAAAADALARALTNLGWRVFVDRSAIPAGTRFDDWIDAALRDTRCVLVLWSESSVASEWVRNEAHEGLDREILVPVALSEGIRIPLAFRRRQTRSLVGWRRDGGTPAELLRDLTRILGDPPASQGNRAPAGKSTRRQESSTTASSTSAKTSDSKGRKKSAPFSAEAVAARLDLEDLDGFAWVSIPGGTFTMGDASEGDATPHRVTLSPFKISRFPVTNDQYWGAVQAGLFSPPSHWSRGVIPDKKSSTQWSASAGTMPRRSPSGSRVACDRLPEASCASPPRRNGNSSREAPRVARILGETSHPPWSAQTSA